MIPGARAATRDDDIVARLHDPDAQVDHLRETLRHVRDGMAWAASTLDPASTARRLLEQRLRLADRALALCERATP